MPSSERTRVAALRHRESEKAWSFLDGEIDQVLKALRAPYPDKAAEVDALNTLLASLG